MNLEILGNEKDVWLLSMLSLLWPEWTQETPVPVQHTAWLKRLHFCMN